MARAAVTRTDRYSHVAIVFHWVIAALVLLNLFIGLFHESLLAGVRGAMGLHMAVGITILVLTVGRIAWRLGNPPPRLPAAMPAWERTAARLSHAGFYALLLALPLTGWLLISGTPRSKPFSWFGLFDVPVLPISRGLSNGAHAVHGPLGYLMAALIVLHVGAALRHHYVLRDGVLARMLPGVRARG